jgi:hypothetical protein
LTILQRKNIKIWYANAVKLGEDGDKKGELGIRKGVVTNKTPERMLYWLYVEEIRCRKIRKSCFVV